MTVNTRVIKILLHSNQLPYVEIQPGLRIQVLPDMSYLARCQKHQFAAFVADRGILIVWDDEPKKLVGRVERLEQALMKMIWGSGDGYPEEKEEKPSQVQVQDAEGPDGEAVHVEKPRRIVLIQPVLTACTLILTIAAIGSGWRRVAIEIFVDHNYIRLAFAALIIPQMWLGLVMPHSLGRQP